MTFEEFNNFITELLRNKDRNIESLHEECERISQMPIFKQLYGDFLSVNKQFETKKNEKNEVDSFIEDVEREFIDDKVTTNIKKLTKKYVEEKGLSKDSEKGLQDFLTWVFHEIDNIL